MQLTTDYNFNLISETKLPTLEERRGTQRGSVND